MAFIFGVATQEADLYRVFRDFVSGRGRPGQVTRTTVGNGELNNLIFPEGSEGLHETFTLTCESTAVRGGTFGVVGSVSGVLPDATVGTVYKHALLEFYIDFGDIDFALGDKFIIQAINKPFGKPGFTYVRGRAETHDEVLTLTCTTAGRQLIEGVQSRIPAVFSVSGSVTGALPDLTQGVAYETPTIALQLFDNQTDNTQYALNDVITLRTSRNPLRKLNQHWEILRQTPSNLVQFDRTIPDQDVELILRGPGLSQADSIYWGMRRSWSTANANAWWTLYGMTGYIPTMTIAEQPTVQGGQSNPRPVHTFWSLEVPYVIIASGRCFKLITRSNIYYSQSYAGFYLPSTMPKYNGYPFFSGGTGDTNDNMWSSLPSGRSSFWNYQGEASGGSAWAMNENIGWSRIYGCRDNGYSRMSSDRTHPYGLNMVHDLRNNLDGSVPAFQVQLTPNRGFLDGVYAVPGRDGRQPEEIMVMRDGKRMLVSQNHHRAGFSDFVAFTLE